MGEDRAVFGGMAQRDALAGAGKDHRMLAHHRAAAQGGKTDIAVLARAGMAVAAFHPMLVQRDLAAACRGLAQQQRGARGRIHLVAMVHFQHFDVVVRQRPSRTFHQRTQQIDAQAHVARLHDHGMAGGGLDARLTLFVKAGGADDMDDARLRRQVGDHGGNHRRGEIDHDLRIRQQSQRIGGQLDAIGLHARQCAAVQPQVGMAFHLQRAAQGQARALRDFANERAAHAAAGAGDDDLQIRHDAPFRSLCPRWPLLFSPQSPWQDAAGGRRS